MRFPPNLLDEIRARLPVSQVVARRVQLKRAGREYKGLSPFKTEKTPSFTVNDQKGFYHCFASGEHGDIFTFVMKTEGLSFTEAVDRLAQEAGVPMPKAGPRDVEAEDRRSRLYELLAASAAFFEKQLAGPQGQVARQYLAKRGLDAAGIARFRLGHAPNSRSALKEHLAFAGFTAAEMTASGMLIAGDDIPVSYDRFRHRVMFPITDLNGRIIAFGGRALDPEAPAKYLNSPETPLFHKGGILFNAHNARATAHDKNRIVVVEGYMDVIAMALAGFPETVAPLGTALTEDQIKLLWRMAPEPILCFDGDAAGRRAAMRAALRALPLLRPGHSLQFVTLPEGMDPDDLLRAKGREALEALLAAPASLLDTLWQHERDAGPLASPEDKAGLKARLMAHVDTIAHGDIKALYRRDLLDRFDALAFAPRERPQRAPFKPFAKGKGPWKPAPAPLAEGHTRKLFQVGKNDGLLAAVISGLIAHPGELPRHAEALARLAPVDPRMAALLDSLIALADIGETLETANLLTILQGQGLRPPAAADYAGMRFGFLGQADDALPELAEAVSLLVEIPAVDAALAEATKRHEAEFSDESFADQQRLRERRLVLFGRLGQMSRTRAAL